MSKPNYKITLLSNENMGLGHYPCADTHSPDGGFFVSYGSADERLQLLSRDGKTFEKSQSKVRHPGVAFEMLPDGTYMGLGVSNAVHRSIIDKNQEVIPFCLAIYRAKSFDAVVEGKITTEFAFVDIPGLSFGFGDSGNSFAGCVGTPCVLSNGDIYVMFYGQFKDDTTLCPYFEEYGNYKFYLYRTWGVVSHDGGKTWEYTGTIADVQTYPIADINAEGYCEPYCVEVEEGHICAIIRTGGHEVYSPLYATHSYDYGKTWEAPYEILSWGVYPRMLKMSDGTLALCSGHIHNFFMFSDDGGRTWSEPCFIEMCDGKWAKSTSGYNSFAEVAPGELTVIFDDPKELLEAGGEEGKVRQVYVRRYRVEKQ